MWTGGCRWRCRRSWPTTPPARSPRPRTCLPGPRGPTCLIKIPGTKEGLPAIEEAIFAGIPVNVTLLFSREHYLAAAEAFCAASSDASRPGSSPRSAPSPRCSSAAGTPRSRARCRRRCATSSASPSPSARTRPAALSSARPAGSACTTRAPARSASCGRAREPRTRKRPTSCTSRRWRRPSP